MRQSLKKDEVLRRLAGLVPIPKRDIGHVLVALRELIVEQARLGNVVKVPGFGSFSLATRKGRIIRNPVTKELQHIPATKTVGFRAVKAVKQAVSR